MSLNLVVDFLSLRFSLVEFRRLEEISDRLGRFFEDGVEQIEKVFIVVVVVFPGDSRFHAIFVVLALFNPHTIVAIAVDVVCANLIVDHPLFVFRFANFALLLYERHIDVLVDLATVEAVLFENAVDRSADRLHRMIRASLARHDFVFGDLVSFAPVLVAYPFIGEPGDNLKSVFTNPLIVPLAKLGTLETGTIAHLFLHLFADRDPFCNRLNVCALPTIFDAVESQTLRVLEDFRHRHLGRAHTDLALMFQNAFPARGIFRRSLAVSVDVNDRRLRFVPAIYEISNELLVLSCERVLRLLLRELSLERQNQIGQNQTEYGQAL